MLGKKLKENFFVANIEPSSRSQEVEFIQGDTILEALLRADVEINNSCGGGASCGTCRVRIRMNRPDSVQPDLPSEIEQEFREERSFAEDERLSCQTLAKKGLEIFVPRFRA